MTYAFSPELTSLHSNIAVLPSNQEIGRPIGVPVHEAAAVLEALLVVIVKRNGGSCSRYGCGPCSGREIKPGPVERSAIRVVTGSAGGLAAGEL